MKKIILFITIYLIYLIPAVLIAAEPTAISCPVTGAKIDPKTAVRYEHRGNVYTFCCEDCVKQFKKEPEKYIAKAPPLSGELKNAVREIKVIAKKYEFLPDPIGVKQGEKVRLKIAATDVDHGFGVKEYNIDKTITKGQEQVVEFLADKAGTFTVKCTIFCGFGHGGMKGRLIVQK